MRRGDTLIEVVVAAALFSLVLTVTTKVATAALAIGLEAQVRSQAASYLQEQAEAVHNLRDNSADWATFTAGITNCKPTFTGGGCYLTATSAGWTVGAATTKAGIIKLKVICFDNVKSTDCQASSLGNKYKFTFSADWDANVKGTNSFSTFITDNTGILTQ